MEYRFYWSKGIPSRSGGYDHQGFDAVTADSDSEAIQKARRYIATCNGFRVSEVQITSMVAVHHEVEIPHAIRGF